MKGILGDINIQGHVRLLCRVWESVAWKDIWTELALPIHTLADLGLPATAPDAIVWHLCQQRELVLLTANRNDEGPESLESTIRQHNTANSLPVFTLADADHVKRSRRYAERVAVKLLEFFMDVEKYRGTGRMYVP